MSPHLRPQPRFSGLPRMGFVIRFQIARRCANICGFSVFNGLKKSGRIYRDLNRSAKAELLFPGKVFFKPFPAQPPLSADLYPRQGSALERFVTL